MSNDTFDVIVIGAGENGLVLGTYLGKAGLEVLVCERRLESGGGLSSEEFTVLGCWHNTGAYYHDTVEVTPIYQDLRLSDANTVYLHPPVQSSLLQRDGESLTLFSDLERTISEISRWSKEDAEAWRRHFEAFHSALDTHYQPYLLNPAKNGMGYEDFDSRVGLTPLEAVQADFKHPLTQALLLSHFMVPRGILCDYRGAGRFLQLVVATATSTRIVEGGSHELAQSLWTEQLRNNGWIWDSTPVRRILIENGQAVGVETSTGRKLHAKVVVSTVDLQTTFQTLVGEEHIPEELAQRVRGYQWEEFSLFVIHAALDEAPRLNSKDADAAKALRWTLGFESAQDIQEHVAQVQAGELPDRLGAMVSCPSLHDPSQALPGKHTFLIWQIVPARLKSREWSDVADSYREQIFSWVSEYFPNVTGKHVLRPNSMSPADFITKWHYPHGAVFGGKAAGDQLGSTRPLAELADFRTPIKNLYLGGAYMHPGAGIEGAPGYIAAKVIADDLGVSIPASV
ncbi:NAD(P)/FAD-dependent oxidoreductase [Acidobacteria bacterium AH-259-D05]|nr:NAD(P)/FAD-dependent oxidoreductase [Acidobacteria bacterium AH-259-D05]